MLKSLVNGKGLKQRTVKSMASLARGIAKDGVENRCFFFIHQPEEPKNLAKRLQDINAKEMNRKFRQ